MSAEGRAAQSSGNTSGGANNRPKTPWYKTCTTKAIGNGLLHVGIDSIGLIPEGGLVSRAVGNYAGYRGIVATQQGTKTIQAGKLGTAIGSTGGFSNDTSSTGLLSTGLGGKYPPNSGPQLPNAPTGPNGGEPTEFEPTPGKDWPQKSVYWLGQLAKQIAGTEVVFPIFISPCESGAMLQPGPDGKWSCPQVY